MNEAKIFSTNNLIPVLNNYAQLKKWAGHLKSKKNIKLMIHIDTGMNRLGFQKNDIIELKKNRKILESFKDVTFMSHLACADEKKNPFNAEQKNKFDTFKKDFPNYKYSLAASGGIFLGKKYHYDMVRPGISLYGGKRVNMLFH